MRGGYKQSSVGVIPEDWEVVSLGAIGESLIGLTYSPSDVSSSGVLVLRSSNIQAGALSFEDNVWVRAAVPEKLMIRSGDILVCARNGSRELIGKSVFISKEMPATTFGAFMAVYRGIDGHYVSHQMRSEIVRRQIREHLGATINQITNKSLNGFMVPYPPTKEERDAIAQVLSDADAAIEALDALIAKKRAVKQAAMQQLLTGRTRLPGFDAGWQEVRLGDVLSFEVGYPFDSSQFHPDEGVRLVRNADLKADSAVVRVRGPYPANFLVSDGDLLVGMDGDFAPVLWKGGKALLNQRVGRVRTTSKCDRTFMRYGLMKPLKAIEDITSATTVKHLSHSDVIGIWLALPQVEEQKEIGAVLSDMDAEVESLFAERDKMRLVKQGTMQELLSGRVRLV